MQGEERTLLEDIHREESGTDVSIEEGTGSLTVRHNRRLLLNQEEKDLAVRPVLSWHLPLHGRCAQAHTILRVQEGPNTLPDRLVPQTLEEASARHYETPFGQALGPRTLIQIFHTHFRALSIATIGSLRCSSKVPILSRFFTGCCLQAWGRRIILPPPCGLFALQIDST